MQTPSVKAWVRALDVCDRPLMKKLGFIVWSPGAWWRVVIVWLFHWTRYRRRYPFSGLACTCWQSPCWLTTRTTRADSSTMPRECAR